MGRNIPTIKGLRKLKSNNCFLTFQEKQFLFARLIKKGLTRSDADKRIKNLINQQLKIAKNLKLKNKSESEIKLKQSELFEKLFYS